MAFPATQNRSKIPEIVLDYLCLAAFAHFLRKHFCADRRMAIDDFVYFNKPLPSDMVEKVVELLLNIRILAIANNLPELENDFRLVYDYLLRNYADENVRRPFIVSVSLDKNSELPSMEDYDIAVGVYLPVMKNLFKTFGNHNVAVLLMPDSWATKESTKPLRRYVASENLVSRVVNFSQHKTLGVKLGRDIAIFERNANGISVVNVCKSISTGASFIDEMIFPHRRNVFNVGVEDFVEGKVVVEDEHAMKVLKCLSHYSLKLNDLVETTLSGTSCMVSLRSPYRRMKAFSLPIISTDKFVVAFPKTLNLLFTDKENRFDSHYLNTLIESKLFLWFYFNTPPKLVTPSSKLSLRRIKSFPVPQLSSNDHCILSVLDDLKNCLEESAYLEVSYHSRSYRQMKSCILSMIDMVIYEWYFREHMTERMLDISEHLYPFFEQNINLTKEKLCLKLYDWYMTPSNKVRERISLIEARSADFIYPIHIFRP